MKKNCLIIVLILVNIYLIFQEKSLRDSLKDFSFQKQSEKQVQNEQAQNVCKEQLETLYEDVSVPPEQDWEPLLATEYCRETENQETAAKLLIGQIIEQNQYDMSRFELEDSCMIQAGGSAKGIYLVRYFEEDNWNSNYCGILADYEEGTCEMLFQADKGLPDNSMEEFYDMKICDADGNGEQDIILLLGEHRGMGEGYYLPDIYCMIGLQRDGTFQFMSSHTDEWLSEITDMLYEEANENRKVENIFPEIRKKFGLSDLVTEKDKSCSVEQYIRKKDERILQKIDRRSLFFERELLWEQFFINEDGNTQSVKIYRESGENGFPAKRAAVYVFDYLTEEAELQAMPQLFEEITDRLAGQGYIENVEVEETEFKDIDGDGEEDIRMIIDVEVSEISGEKKNETYTMNFMQEKDKYNELKMFRGVLAEGD